LEPLVDVILDANVFISDLWLHSQRMRFFLDYLAKTGSHVWILEPVWGEVSAYARRHFREPLSTIESALALGKRRSILGLPEIASDAILDQTFRAWEEQIERAVEGRAVRLPLIDHVLAEAFRRATERIPPCSVEGGQMRDAVIWLTALEHLRDRSPLAEVAFISNNTRDFAAADKVSLRDELQADLAGRGVKLAYYPSLENFLKLHAEPIRHVTLEWIQRRIDKSRLTELVEEYLRVRVDRFFRPAPRYLGRDRYEPFSDAEPFIFPFEVQIDSFFVWRFAEDSIEVGLMCSAAVEADIECRRSHPVYVFDPDRDYETDILTCVAEVGLHFAADVEGDALLIRALDDCYPA
jgi:hypothetical protein